MSAGSSESSSLGRGRSLAVPAFPDDDGAADAAVRALLADGAVTSVAAARALRDVRLLTSVVAVADEIDEAGGDKSSHMAVVSMVNERGERGLLAFTGTDSLTAWNPEARPVPAEGRDVARAAIDDGASAVVLDVAGPVRRVVTGLDLLVLADAVDVARVEAMVREALADLTADGRVDLTVRDVRGDGGEIDVLVEVGAPEQGRPDGHAQGQADGRADGRDASDLAQQAASVLAGRRDIQRLVPGGLGVTLVDAT